MSKPPKLVVFDLDYTIWPFWIDCHCHPPFKKIETSGKPVYVDARGRKINIYPEMLKVLEDLRERKIDCAVASRTTEIKGATQLLELMDLDKYFKLKQIYPGCKKQHFQYFAEHGYPHSECLFFDDEQRNHDDLEPLGVTGVLVKQGVTWDVYQNGMKKYQESH